MGSKTTILAMHTVPTDRTLPSTATIVLNSEGGAETPTTVHWQGQGLERLAGTSAHNGIMTDLTRAFSSINRLLELSSADQ